MSVESIRAESVEEAVEALRAGDRPCRCLLAFDPSDTALRQVAEVGQNIVHLSLVRESLERPLTREGVGSLARLKRLDSLLLNCFTDMELFTELFARSRITGLRCDIGAWYGAESGSGAVNARMISQNRYLTRLSVQSMLIGPQGARVLSMCRCLRILHLSGDPIGDEGALALSRCVTLQWLSLPRNDIGLQGARALATLPCLTWLALDNNRVGDEGAAALATSQSLCDLDLDGNDIGADGACALSKAACLKKLNLKRNHIGTRGAAALAASQLIRLSLNGNRVGDEEATELSKSTHLTTLTLGGNNVGDVGATALSKSTNLTTLELGGNKVGNAGARALATSSSLVRLELEFNNLITDEGVKELARSRTVTSVIFDGVGNEGIAALAANRTMTFVRYRRHVNDPTGPRNLAHLLDVLVQRLARVDGSTEAVVVRVLSFRLGPQGSWPPSGWGETDVKAAIERWSGGR